MRVSLQRSQMLLCALVCDILGQWAARGAGRVAELGRRCAQLDLVRQAQLLASPARRIFPGRQRRDCQGDALVSDSRRIATSPAPLRPGHEARQQSAAPQPPEATGLRAVKARKASTAMTTTKKTAGAGSATSGTSRACPAAQPSPDRSAESCRRQLLAQRSPNCNGPENHARGSMKPGLANGMDAAGSACRRRRPPSSTGGGMRRHQCQRQRPLACTSEPRALWL